jgi:hypothetical protein
MKIMKTKLLKKFAILSLGLMGLFFIGNNLNSTFAQSVDKCPGGTCTFTYTIGDSCTACCAKADIAECDVWGCKCKERSSTLAI